MQELQRMREGGNTLQEVLMIKELEELKKFPRESYCSISLFNSSLY